MNGPQDESELARTLGEQIRRLRRRRGWTQRRLADAAGVVQQNLSLYERGLASPRLATLGRLAAALGAEIRLEPVSARAPAEPAPGELAPGELAPGLMLSDLMDYVDRQVRRAVERERKQARAAAGPARDAG